LTEELSLVWKINNMSQGIPGGENWKGKREQNEYSHNTQTPLHVAEIITKNLYERFCKDMEINNILDACCGYGALGFTFNKLIPKAKCDYVDKECPPLWIDKSISDNFSRKDITECYQRQRYDIILCNPPWTVKKAELIYHHVINLLKPNGILFFLIQNIFIYQGYDRSINHKWDAWMFLPCYIYSQSGAPKLDCGIGVYINDKPFEQKENRIFMSIPPSVKKEDKYDGLQELWTRKKSTTGYTQGRLIPS
jgi:hypothetical protein